MANDRMDCRGMSLNYISTWFEKAASKKKKVRKYTTGDVVEMLVLKESSRDESFIERLESTNPAVVKNKADYFVSHAWKYNFGGLLLAVQNFQKKNNLDDVYIWLDIFTVNQHLAKEAAYDSEWFSTSFHQGIQDIGHTLLVLEPWADPMPLKRSWCLWEIFGSIKENCKFDICLSPAEESDFIARLEEEFNTLAETTSGIDVSKADAFSKEDRDMIYKSVEETIGFEIANETVKEPLRDWMVTTGKAKLKELRELYQEKRPARVHLFMTMLAQVIMDQGHHKEACEMYREALQMYTSHAKSHNKDGVAYYQMLLGECLLEQGENEEALDLFNEAFRVFKKKNKSNNLRQSVINDLGMVHLNLKRYEESLGLFQELQKVARNKKDPSYYALVNNISQVYIEQGNHEKAIQYLEETVEQLREDLGSTNSKTATALANLARAYLLSGETEKAESFYEEALASFISSKGKKHAGVGIILFLKSKAVNELGDTQKAEELRLQAIHIVTEALGSENKLTQKIIETSYV